MSASLWPFNTDEWISMRNAVARIETYVKRIDRNLNTAKIEEDKIMQTLDDVITDITDLGSKEDGLITLTGNIKAQLDAILAGALTPAQQAKVDAVFAAVEARKTAVVTAITANTTP